MNCITKNGKKSFMKLQLRTYAQRWNNKFNVKLNCLKIANYNQFSSIYSTSSDLYHPNSKRSKRVLSVEEIHGNIHHRHL